MKIFCKIFSLAVFSILLCLPVFADSYMNFVPDKQIIIKYIQMPCQGVFSELDKRPPSQAISYSLVLASIHLSQSGNIKTARDYCQYALQMASANNLNKAEILYLLAVISNEKNDLLGCMEILDKSAEAAKNENDPNILKKCLSFLGNTAYRYGDFNKSLSAYIQLQKLCRENQDKLADAGVSFEMGEVYYRLSKINEAKQAANHSIEIFKDVNDEKGLGDCFKLLGNVYSAQNDDANAQESYSLASRHYENTNDWHGIGNCSFNLGLLYGRLKKYDQAIDSLNKACFYYTKSSSTEGIGIAQMEIGRIYYLQERFEQADASLKQAEYLLTQSNARFRLAQVQDYIADVKSSQNQVQQADIYYKRSIENYNNINLPADVNRVKEKLNKLKK